MSISAEPQRKAPYSPDLRWRIVWQRLAHELSFREIARNLNVAVSTVYRTWDLFEQTGNVDPSPTPHQPRRDQRRLDDAMALFVVGLVMERPEMYLQEITDHTGIEVSEATICRELRRHGFSRKKIRVVASQRSIELTGKFMAQALLFSKGLFVWVDETGCDRWNYIRKYGYAIQGFIQLYSYDTEDSTLDAR